MPDLALLGREVEGLLVLRAKVPVVLGETCGDSDGWVFVRLKGGEADSTAP